MGTYTRGIIIAIFGVIILVSYLSATQGWMAMPLRNPTIYRKSQQERDSLHRAGGTSSAHIYRGGSYSSGSRFNSSRSSSSSRSFRGGSSGGRGK
ncbi:MAG: hypothetical protein MUE85_06270 [Microscillaceae bacterium]|jgi:uncharacterized membrane protein YgcG|nr:hypothetical protein [Microscillaceae bacterium]